MKSTPRKTVKHLFFINMIKISGAITAVMFISTLVILYSNFSQNRHALFLLQLDHIDEQLNDYLDSMLELSRSVSANSTIQTHASFYEDTPRSFDMENQLTMVNALSPYLLSYDYLHSITIYSADKSLLATTHSLYSTARPFADIPTRPTWYTSEKPPLKNWDSPTRPLSRIQPFYRVDSGKLLGYIEITLSEETLNALMRSKNNSGHLIMVDRDNLIKATSGELSVGSRCEIPYTALTMDKQRYSSAYRSFYLQGQNSRLQWSIISMTGFFDYLKPLFSLLAIVSLIALVCFMLSRHIATKLAESLTAPIYHLIKHTQKIKDGYWLPIDPYPINTDDLALLYQEFDHMVLAQENLKNHLIDEQKAKDKLALDLLQQQVNPHFLYNTLDNICALAEIGDTPVLIELVMNLSQFYKSGLSNGRLFLRMRDEISLCEAYLQIMHIRYYHKFDHEIVCEPELLDCYCIKLLLQPIIENSIYHGIKENSGKGLIHIRIEPDGEDIRITVMDNGVGLVHDRKSSSSGGFGLENIRQRIRLYYGEGYGLSIQNRPEGGCITTIRIPRQTIISQ